MDQDIFDKAHAILTERRTRARAENDMRISKINSAVPEIKEINDALFNTGYELIRLITDPDAKDAEARIEEIKQRNLGAQQLAKELLISHGYPEDYLDICYTCPDCSDTGYIGGEFCHCLTGLFGKLTAEKLNHESLLKLSSFDTFSLKYYHGDDQLTMGRILNFAREYSGNFNEDSGSILMFGNTGLGKTHISLAIANEVLKTGKSVIYDSVINLLRMIEKEHFSFAHSSDTLDNILSTDLLILDDLGTEFETKFYNSVIYNIVNTRLIREKATIINTNLELEEISQRYGGKVASRIATMYTCLKFVGDDVRFQKKYQEK